MIYHRIIHSFDNAWKEHASWCHLLLQKILQNDVSHGIKMLQIKRMPNSLTIDWNSSVQWQKVGRS